MITTKEIIDIYISFFEKRGHKRIPNAPLIPQNDPTTLFTSSGMQPLVPYLLGEKHPLGRRLVNVQNCFRAVDIEEVGDTRHTTFFRMLGNWSLGDYGKKEQLPWFFEFLTKELGLSPSKLYVSVFQGYNDIPQDNQSAEIWTGLFESVGLNPKEHIFYYGTSKNWWSRAGEPENMPEGEPGGPSSEVFYDFETPHDTKFGRACHINCDCGRYMEIGNSVFMEYKKANAGFNELSQKNVDFGGGLERFLAAIENKQDIFTTNLFAPIIKTIEKESEKSYKDQSMQMRIISDHLSSAVFMVNDGITPSNTDQGYILRRLIRRSIDNLDQLGTSKVVKILESIVIQYSSTDSNIQKHFEKIRYVINEEQETYKKTVDRAKSFIAKKYEGKRQGDDLMGVKHISPDDAFILYSTHGLSSTQIKSLGYTFDIKLFAKKMEEHQDESRKGAEQKFAGGLADNQTRTVMGHTATHLLHQALRDMLGNNVHQTGSNITAERLRFDFNYDKRLTDEEIQKIQDTVNDKIKQDLSVHFEMMPLEKAKEKGAIGLFDEKYQDTVKIYFIGNYTSKPYSIEFCGGPHVEATAEIKNFTIIKQENIGHGQRRIYATVG